MEQYYTPPIEDLHVGYECEMNHLGPRAERWDKTVFSKYDMYDQMRDLESPRDWEIRTPYLTKEQIVAEGWEDISVEGMGTMLKRDSYFIAPGFCYQYPSGDIVYVYWTIVMTHKGVIYTGKIPSINEFRVICKLLGV